MLPRRSWLLMLVLSATALAGCMTNGPPQANADTPTDIDPITTQLPWSLTDCHFLNAFVTVPLDQLQAQLPDGFTVAGSPYLGIESFDCGSGAGAEGEVQGMDYGSYFTSVVPPENLEIPGASDYYYKWWVLVPDEERRNLFAQYGMNAQPGDAAVDDDLTAVGPVHIGVVHADGIGHHVARMVTTESRGASDGEWFGEFSPLANGQYARWQTNYSVDWMDVGRGTIEVPEGSMASALMGNALGQASMIRGVWSFHGGSITLPAAALGTPASQ